MDEAKSNIRPRFNCNSRNASQQWSSWRLRHSNCDRRRNTIAARAPKWPQTNTQCCNSWLRKRRANLIQ